MQNLIASEQRSSAALQMALRFAALQLAPRADAAAADGQSMSITVTDVAGVVPDSKMVTVTIGQPQDLLFADGFE